MLGFIRLIQRLKEPKRPRTRRITIVESSHAPKDSAKSQMGLEVARVMGWRHFDARQDSVPSEPLANEEDCVVISQAFDYKAGSRDDGLTVRVDDVCDLRDTQDLTQCLRAIMNALHPGKRANPRI